MNNTTVYIGSYIKAKMPQTERLSTKKYCELCNFFSTVYFYCPEHGTKLNPRVESVVSHPIDFLNEMFDDEDSEITYEFLDNEAVVFLPNLDEMGGLYVWGNSDEEHDIPPVYLEGGWQKLIAYLQEHDIPHEIKYGVLTVTEK